MPLTVRSGSDIPGAPVSRVSTGGGVFWAKMGVFWRRWLQISTRGNPNWVWEAGGLYIGQVGWPVYANALGTPLARPVIAFVTAKTPYGL